MTISKEEVLIIHHELIKLFGGSPGIRDLDLLESALARIDQTFDGKSLYPSAIEKAAAMGESIIMNHPFIDGNKRTGLVLMETILSINAKIITGSEEFIYDFIIRISTGELRYDEIVKWLKENTKGI